MRSEFIFAMLTRNVNTERNFPLFIALNGSLAQGNVFTCVCQSFCSQVVAVLSRRVPWRGWLRERGVPWKDWGAMKEVPWRTPPPSVNKQSVWILLECILVMRLFNIDDVGSLIQRILLLRTSGYSNQIVSSEKNILIDTNVEKVWL